MSVKNYARYYFILTIFGIIILFLISLLSKPAGSISFFDKLAVVSTFVFCCVIGISLSIYPAWIKRLLKNHKISDKGNKNIKKIKFNGHHPDCEKFNSHTIKISKKTYCAGCLGLIIGFALSIIISIIYLLNYTDFNLNVKFSMLYIGILTVIIVLVEISTITKPVIHIFSNIFFIVAILLILLGILEITHDKSYGFISIMISFIFIQTRIHLSKLKHTNTCNNCSKECKIY